MRSVLVTFAILLAILLAISALGGSLNVSEKFYEDIEKEAFYEDVENGTDQTEESTENENENDAEKPKEEAENMENTPPTITAGPTTVTDPVAKETFYQTEEAIEPFEEDNNFMPY